MSRLYGFMLKAVTVVQLGALAACSAAAAIGPGEVTEVSLGADSMAGFGGTGTTLSDDFETPGTWGFYSSTSSGIGYVATSPDAVSPTHVGSQYDRRGASGYQVLFRNFTVPAKTTQCSFNVLIKPLSDVTGQVEVLDAVSKTSLGTKPFQLVAGGWSPVFVSTTTAPSAGALSVRVELDHNGTFQQLLVDDLSGNCGLSP